MATPPSQMICSGSTTSIALSSNVPGTTFSWKVVESGVIGASAGSGASINQTLRATTHAVGTATYTVTPSINGCTGNPLTLVVTVELCRPKPPHHFRGKLKGSCRCQKKEITHDLSWKPSHDPSVLGYQLYQNGKLIKILSANKKHVSLHLNVIPMHWPPSMQRALKVSL